MSTNQCDGCARGLPVTDGNHYEGDLPVMACTADRYAPAAAPPDVGEMVKEWRELRTHYSHPAAVLAWADNAAALLSQPKPEPCPKCNADGNTPCAYPEDCGRKPQPEPGGEGEVVVPREPTEEMKEAWNYACRDMPGCAWWEPSYRAMLDAAMLAKVRT